MDNQMAHLHLLHPHHHLTQMKLLLSPLEDQEDQVVPEDLVLALHLLLVTHVNQLLQSVLYSLKVHVIPEPLVVLAYPLLRYFPSVLGLQPQEDPSIPVTQVNQLLQQFLDNQVFPEPVVLLAPPYLL